MKHEQGETDKVYINPEDLPYLISPEQLEEVEAHQQQAFHEGRFVQSPWPDTKDKSLRETYNAFANNCKIYKGDINEAIDADDIIVKLRPEKPRDITPEKARAIRIRSSVVAAHKILFERTVDSALDQADPDDDHSDSYAS